MICYYVFKVVGKAFANAVRQEIRMSEEAAKRHAQESVFEYRVPQTLGVAMAWKTCLDRDEDHLYKPKIKGVFDYIDLATSTFSPSYT